MEWKHVANGSIPVWPLPCDWRRAGDSNPPPASYEKPNPTMQCPHCLEWLSFAPNDATSSFRRHKRNLKCKKGREVVAMNREGFHVMSVEGKGFSCQALAPFQRKGKYYMYYPAPIVSYVRWKSPSGGANNIGIGSMLPGLLKFLKLSEPEQVAYLSGVILEFEADREVRGYGNLGDHNIPF